MPCCELATYLDAHHKLPTCPSKTIMYTAAYMFRVLLGCFPLLVRMLPSNVGTYLLCVASYCVIYCECVPGAGLRTLYIAVYMCRVFFFFFVVRIWPSNVRTYLV